MAFTTYASHCTSGFSQTEFKCHLVSLQHHTDADTNVHSVRPLHYECLLLVAFVCLHFFVRSRRRWFCFRLVRILLSRLVFESRFQHCSVTRNMVLFSHLPINIILVNHNT